MVIAYTDTPLQESIRKQAGLVIADNMDAASDERNALLADYIEKIKEANREAMMFSHVCLYFDISELKNPIPVIRQAEAAGIGIIADTMNTAWRRSRSRAAYLDYIKRAMDAGIMEFRIDDAQKFSAMQLRSMMADVPGIRWILSTGVKYATAMTGVIMQADADCKLEVQAYRHGSSTNYVQKWLNEIPMNTIAFECYRTENGKVTSTKDIAAMGSHVIASGISSIMVYGHDENTSFLLDEKHARSMAAQWRALQAFLKRWWLIEPVTIVAA